MVHDRYRILAGALAILSLLVLAGCAQKSPEELVAETRTQYFVEPTGMLIQEIEAEDALEAAEADQGDGPAEDVAGAAEAEEAAEGEESMEEGAEADGPRTVQVLFDLIVRFDGRQSLPGITVDVSHNDPFDKEKARYQQWIETDGMSRGDARQLDFSLEIPDYETGDQFAIEFQAFIPPEERGNYREFSEAAP